MPPQLRQAMEQVAGRAESLVKSKMTQEVPPPFRKRVTRSVQQLDWDRKKYSNDGKESRDERNRKRTIRVFGIEQLGLDEYQKLMREIDSMMGSVELGKIVNKRVQEVKKRLESERRAREADEGIQTRNQTEKAGTSAETEPVPPVPVGSPRKRKQEDDRKETGGKKPKAVEHKDTAGKTPKAVERKNTGAKKPKTPVKSTKDDDHHDELTSRKWKATDKGLKPIDTVDESQSRGKKCKKTAAVPLLEDDNDQDDDDLMIVDDDDRDKNYAPGDDEQDDDDDDYPVLDNDDDDFQEPPPHARKMTKKEKKQTKKQATQRRVEQSKKDDDDAINEETLSLFQ